MDVTIKCTYKETAWIYKIQFEALYLFQNFQCKLCWFFLACRSNRDTYYTKFILKNTQKCEYQNQISNYNQILGCSLLDGKHSCSHVGIYCNHSYKNCIYKLRTIWQIIILNAVFIYNAVYNGTKSILFLHLFKQTWYIDTNSFTCCSVEKMNCSGHSYSYK